MVLGSPARRGQAKAKTQTENQAMMTERTRPDRLAELLAADLDARTGQTAAERRAEIDRRIDERLASIGRAFMLREMQT